MARVYQSVKKKMKALKNKNAKYKLTYKYSQSQTSKNNKKLNYKESYSRKITNLQYKD